MSGIGALLGKKGAEAAAGVVTTHDIAIQDVYAQMGHSTALGILLMTITLLSIWLIPKKPVEVRPDGTVKDRNDRWSEMVLNSSNIVFLCLGVTGVMILVNNDLARAFAIGAAIALVRFRVKMDESTSSGLFFAVIIGMACGVNQIVIGWMIVLLFAALKSAVLILVRFEKPKITIPQVNQNQNHIVSTPKETT